MRVWILLLIGTVLSSCQRETAGGDILILREFRLVQGDGSTEPLHGAPPENSRVREARYQLVDTTGRAVVRVSETLWTLAFDEVRGIVRRLDLEPTGGPCTIRLELFEQPDPLTQEAILELGRLHLPSWITSGRPSSTDHLLGRGRDQSGLHPEGYQLVVWSRPSGMTAVQEHVELDFVPQVELSSSVTFELAVVVAREWTAETVERLFDEVGRTRP